jgi:hypothetical protein
MTWERKFDYIAQRDFGELLAFWTRRSPIGIEIGQNCLAEHITDLAEDGGLPTDGEKYIGPVESRWLISELYCGVMKSFNLSFHSQSLATTQAFSNGSLHAFNCVIQFMLAIIAIFGVFVIRVGGKYYIIDIFPWFGHHREDRQLRKLYGDDWWRYCRIIADRNNTIEQKEIVALFKRCIRMVTSVGWREFIVQGLLDCPARWFNRPRNNILYNFTGWTASADLMLAVEADCVGLISRAILSIFDADVQVTYGPMPQSLLLGSLLLPVWERFREGVAMELDGSPAPDFPAVGDSSLIVEFERALDSAIARGVLA